MQKDDWQDALPHVYNCYTIIKDTEEMASSYRMKAEKCYVIAAMLENSARGKNTFSIKISDTRLIKELQAIGIKVEYYGDTCTLKWNPEELMSFISTKK